MLGIGNSSCNDLKAVEYLEYWRKEHRDDHQGLSLAGERRVGRSGFNKRQVLLEGDCQKWVRSCNVTYICRHVLDFMVYIIEIKVDIFGPLLIPIVLK